MKTGCTIIFSLLFFIVYSQNTFNKRIHFNHPNSVLTSVEVTDSCYYASGVIRDTLPPNRLGYLFARFDLEGELVFAKTLTSPVKSYQSWKNILSPTPDGNFVNAGYSTGDLPKAFLVKHKPDGEVMYVKEYYSPYAPTDYFITMQGLQVSPLDSGIIMTTIVVDPVNVANHTYVFKTDKEGDNAWGEVYYHDSDLNYTGFSLRPNGNGNYLIGGAQHNDNTTNINYTYQTYLFQIDSLGNVEWEYLSPLNELQFWASDVLPASDGGYVIASGKGTEYVNGTAATVLWENYIYKIDANKQFQWGTDIRGSRPSGNYLTKLIEVPDGSGYAVAGRISEPNYDEPGIDTYGIIAKLSPDGDSLWTRLYHHVVSKQDDHYFYDVEATADGGFIMVGEAKDGYGTGEPPQQRAWIVKVDEHGCLVPGCHLIGAAEEPKLDIKLDLFPNPTSDYLNVFYYDPVHSGEVNFRIVDVQGRVMQSFSSRVNDITHIISLSGYAAGQYFLQAEVRGAVVSKAFVVGR